MAFDPELQAMMNEAAGDLWSAEWALKSLAENAPPHLMTLICLMAQHIYAVHDKAQEAVVAGYIPAPELDKIPIVPAPRIPINEGGNK